MSNFGKNLKKIRQAKQISQTKLAELFNLTRASIGAYEESRAEPKIDSVIRIANYFSIPIQDLLCSEMRVSEIYQMEQKNKKLDKYHNSAKTENIENHEILLIPWTQFKDLADTKKINSIKQNAQFLRISHPDLDETCWALKIESTKEIENYVFCGDILVVKPCEDNYLKINEYYLIADEKLRLLKLSHFNENQLDFHDLTDSTPFILNQNFTKTIWKIILQVTKPRFSEFSISKKLELMEYRITQLESNTK